MAKSKLALNNRRQHRRSGPHRQPGRVSPPTHVSDLEILRKKYRKSSRLVQLAMIKEMILLSEPGIWSGDYCWTCGNHYQLCHCKSNLGW